MIFVTLPKLRRQLEYSHYYRVTKHLGGVRKIGAEALVPLSAVLEVLGTFEAMRMLAMEQQPSATRARAFAAEIADEAWRVFWVRPAAFVARKAVSAAKDFVAGRIRKPALASAHEEALAAETEARRWGGFENSLVLVMRAAAACSAPFGNPGEMIWNTYVAARGAAAMPESHWHATIVVEKVLIAANGAYQRLRPPHWTDEERAAAANVFVAAREAGFGQLRAWEVVNQQFDATAARQLRTYLQGDEPTTREQP